MITVTLGRPAPKRYYEAQQPHAKGENIGPNTMIVNEQRRSLFIKSIVEKKVMESINTRLKSVKHAWILREFIWLCFDEIILDGH